MGNGNRYPPGHEHVYLSACMYWGMHVRASKMNGNLLCSGASSSAAPQSALPQSSAQCTLRLWMSTSNLESMMRVAIEGPYNDFDDILTSALDLWKDAAKFRYLYSNP